MIATIMTIVSPLMAGGVAWGVVTATQKTQREDIAELKAWRSHTETLIGHMGVQLAEVRNDVKWLRQYHEQQGRR